MRFPFTRLAALAAVLTTTWPAGVRAADVVEVRAQASSWYGWQTLLADTFGVGLLAAGIAASDPGHDDTFHRHGTVLAPVGMAAFVLAAPSVHGILHQQTRQALGSLGLRLGAPLVGGALGLAAVGAVCGPQSSEACPVGPIVIGLGVGALAASVIDAVALAREAAPGGRTVLPVVVVAGDRLTLGLAGRF